MIDNRRLIRKVANAILEITDHNTGTSLGQVVNITREGFLLISREPITIDAIFQMDMHLHQPIDNIEKITFGASSLWSSQARQADSFWTGFNIIDISPESIATIEQMTKGWQADNNQMD